MPSIDYCKVAQPDTEGILYQIMHLAGLGSVAKIADAIAELDDSEFKEQILFCLAEAQLTGLFAMFENYFSHLDQKPDNLVVNQKGGIYLIDFGCSVQSTNGLIDGEKQIGDRRFFSPERYVAFHTSEPGINRQLQGDKIDIWAVGLTLIAVLTKTHFPQPLEMCDELLDQTSSVNASERIKSFGSALERKLEQKFPSLINPPPGTIRSFIKFLLNPNPDMRPNAKEAMTHPWFMEKAQGASKWKQTALGRLSEMVQALQREKRVEVVQPLGQSKTQYRVADSPNTGNAYRRLVNEPETPNDNNNHYKRPGAKQVQVAASATQPATVSSLSPQELPLPHFTDYIERKELQEKFTQRISSYLSTFKPESPSNLLVCEGGGGTGKTLFTTYMLHQIKSQYGFVLYFRGADQISYIGTQHIALAKELGLVGDKTSVEDATAALHRYLANCSKPSLVVFDNADDADLIRPFLPSTGCQVVVTTRSNA